MSVENIFKQNNNDIYCRTLYANNIESTQSPSSVRAIINNQSNPDPESYGLLIPAGSLQFAMPLTIDFPGVGIMKPYLNDINGDYTVNASSITINNPGKYRVSTEVAVLGTIANDKVAQVFQPGSIVLQAPNICSSATSSTNYLTVSFPTYNKAYIMSSSNLFILTSDMLPFTLELALLLNNALDNNAVTLNSNLSIQKII